MKAIAQTFLLGVLALGAGTSATPAFGQSTAPALAPVDSIVAVIDEDVILRSELDRAVANVLAQYAQHPEQLPPHDVLEKQVLERLISMRLQVARADSTGIRITDSDLEQAIGQVAKQNHITVDQVRGQLEASGISFSEYRDNLRDELTVQRLRQSYVQSRVQVSDTEIDQLLSMRQVGGPEIHLANILIGLPDGATPEQIATAQKKADGIYDLIQRGEMDFKSAAIRYSDSQNALDGGEIGWRGYDAIPPAFVSMLRNMKPGEVSQPVRGPSGYQLIQVIETRDPQPQKVVEYKAQDIMVKTTDVVSSEVARQKIEALRERIVAGEDFGKIAQENSDDTLTRNHAGDMGWFQANQWGTSIATQIQSLADGELSQPFQSDVGWHLIKRIGVREQDVTEENRRNQAREIIGQRKAEEEYERFLRQLHSEAYIETRVSAS